MIHVRYNKGSALATVLIAMFVTVTLGTTLLGVSVFADKQSHMEYGRMQAYQLARSGAEAGLAALSEELGKETVSLPSGTATMYLDESMNLVSAVPSLIKGRFDVTIGTSGGEYVVTSIGNASGSTQTVTARVQVNSRMVSVDEALTSMTGEWYDANGQVKHDSKGNGKDFKVKIDPPGALKMEQQETTFEAPKIVFQCEVHNSKERLNIKADIIVFERVMKDFHPNADGIVMKIYDIGFDRAGGKFGKVQYLDEWYWFPDGFTLYSLNDFSSLEKVTGSDIPVGSSTTKEVKDLSVKWGRG